MRASKKNIHPIDLAWAAVAGADRINSGNFYGPNSIGIPAESKFNKTVAISLLHNTETLTEEDHKFGEELKAHFAGLLFKVLSGNMKNDFLSSVSDIIGKELVSDADMAYIAPLARSYRNDIEKEKKLDREMELASTSKFIGTIGSRVQLKIRLINSVYIMNYSFYVYTATDGENLIKFSSPHGVDKFRPGVDLIVKGSVKSHLADRRVNETWLNRVSVLT